MGDRRRETGDGTQETGARGSQETGDSRRQKRVYENRTFAFFGIKILAPFIMLRLGCSRSPLKEETLSHLIKISNVSEVTPTVV